MFRWTTERTNCWFHWSVGGNGRLFAGDLPNKKIKWRSY